MSSPLAPFLPATKAVVLLGRCPCCGGGLASPVTHRGRFALLRFAPHSFYTTKILFPRSVAVVTFLPQVYVGGAETAEPSDPL
jgi:hypothetical protein